MAHKLPVYAARETNVEADVGRRELLKLLAAGLALGGGACAQRPREKVLPYSEQPPEVRPGVSLAYATSMVLDGFATGLLGRTYEGRPTKLEGNPDHPASGGATHVFEQASILELYDPTRLGSPKRRGSITSWRAALSALSQAMTAGERPWFVMPPQSSPVIASLVDAIRERRPLARFTFRSPVGRTAVYRAARRLFGRPLEAQYDFRRARCVLSLDADFLDGLPMSLRWARDWAEQRRTLDAQGAMSRLYVAETMPSATGSVADHHIPLGPSKLGALAAGVLRGLTPRAAQASDAAQLWPGLTALVNDLARARGESVVIAGPAQPAAVHVIAALLNATLDNVGRTVFYTEPALVASEGGDTLTELAAALDAGAVDTLALLDVNPVYDAPPELGLARAMQRAKHSFHLSYFENETSRACDWLLPQQHYLESWGDGLAYDGTWSSVQPLIEPLQPSRSLLEILALFVADPAPTGHALLTQYWRARLPDFDAAWAARLQRGCDPATAFARVTPEPDWNALPEALETLAAANREAGLELNFQRSPSVYDGRFANNPWLQELPHPVTKQTWGNAAIVSPHGARELGVTPGDVLRLSRGSTELQLPALVVDGHAEGAITVALGYGRGGEERIAAGVGANAFKLRSRDELSPVAGVRAERTGARDELAVTQGHIDDAHRPIALSTDLETYRRHPDFTAEERGEAASWLPRDHYTGTQWAMTIDTLLCTGCSSCVIACQAENNVPVVGKAGVRKSREMHWLRIDRYVTTHGGRRSLVNQPMLCQHCEKAPCEYVCPVNATVHSPDGLNEMVYNRCIGTRFCSNNCPYKVRRFNFFKYTADGTTRELQRNPDVTVRDRGVMEKCTFCVQRLRGAEIRTRVERRALRDGEVQTACQQACPTQAIQFGSLEHQQSAMVAWRREPRAYEVLHELNTRPRVVYLAKIDNPNRELAG